MEMLDKFKVMLDIAQADTGQDERLNLIIENAQSALLTCLPDDETVPEKLEYIVIELAIIRFNRIGNEGMKSFSQEGEKIDYSLSGDLTPFMPAIYAYLNVKDDAKKSGQVRFL